MCQGLYSVHHGAVPFFCLLGKDAGRAVHASHRGYDPDFISGTGPSVVPQITVKPGFLLRAEGGPDIGERPVPIFNQALQVGNHIMYMDVFPRLYLPGCLSDGQTVLNDLTAFFNLS